MLAEQIASLGVSQTDQSRILSIAYTRAGNYAKVIEIGEAYEASHGEPTRADYLTANQAIAYTRTGQEAKARAKLDYLEHKAKRNAQSAYRLALAYAELGHKDEAIALLQRCYAAHDDRLVWLKAEPYFDSLRADPRFQDLLRKMNLAPEA